MNNAWCEAITNHCKLHYNHMIFHCQWLLWSEMVAVVEFHGNRSGMRALVSNCRTHSLLWKKGNFHAKKNRRKWTLADMVQTLRAHHCAAHSINTSTCMYKYVDQKRLSCHVSCQEASRCHLKWIWGIHCVQARKYASQGIQPSFETQGRYHQKSKTGLSVAPQKGLMSSKNF